MKKQDDEALINELVDKRVAALVPGIEEKLKQRLVGHDHFDPLSPYGAGRVTLASEDEDERLYRDKYDHKAHVRIGFLRDKDLNNSQAAKFLNSETGETFWTEERVRVFFARAMSLDRSFSPSALKAERERQMAAEKWTIARPVRQRHTVSGEAREWKDTRPTSPGEIWVLERQGLSPQEMAKKLGVDLADLEEFIAKNRRYIDAISWRD